MKYLVYDLEIIKAIPPKEESERIPGIEYCSGWRDFQSMGISVVGWATHEDDDWGCHVYDGYNLEFLSRYQQEGYLIGGFNSRKFDDLLVSAHGVDVVSDFDILDMVLETAGVKGKAYWRDGRSYSLDKIVSANGMEKTGRGDLAPILWQQGKYQEVVDYCANDAWIEREVLRLLLSGDLIDPNTGEKLFHSGIG